MYNLSSGKTLNARSLVFPTKAAVKKYNILFFPHAMSAAAVPLSVLFFITDRKLKLTTHGKLSIEVLWLVTQMNIHTLRLRRSVMHEERLYHLKINIDLSRKTVRVRCLYSLVVLPLLSPVCLLCGHRPYVKTKAWRSLAWQADPFGNTCLA